MPPSPALDRRLDLERLPVLVVDCQTTGATPERGHLLEVAWGAACASASRPPAVNRVLVALPPGERVPPRVTALTGITDDDLAGACVPGEVWRRLAAAAGAVASRGGTSAAVAVAHFARFERAFLEALHHEHAAGEPFPLDLVCTHEIACRLLPELPRRGLRALAGRLGHVLGEAKSAEAHVLATAVVWSELVARLRAEDEVHTLDDLRAWLAATKASRRGGRDFALARETRLGLPDAPGVYRMLGRNGEVLYLGKATSLRRRVNGYFQKRRHGREHVPEMLTQTWAVDVAATSTALEAALLESDEIKEHEPPYNVALRARATAPCFADADLEAIATTPDGPLVLGPFPRAHAVEDLRRLRALLASSAAGVDLLDVCRALGLADDTALEAGAARLGLRVLRASLGLRRASRLTLRALLAHGARLWRERLAARAARLAADGADEVEEEQNAAEAEAERDWTPERVASHLLGRLCASAHLLRRAHWLVATCESSLVWRPQGATPPRGARLLVVERGRVVRAADVPPDTPAPDPPGWPRSPVRRLACFDAATYDRLRVLTSELRRLVAGDAEVDLCLGPRRRYGRAGLARRLKWV